MLVQKKKLIADVSDVISDVKAEILYVPFPEDAHSDHAAVFEAVSACTKSFRYPHVRIVRCYETISETEFSITPGRQGFRPNLWIDITDYLEKKIEIMKLYSEEVAPHPFPRSEENIRALAAFRGATAGFFAAESFMTLIQREA